MNSGGFIINMKTICFYNHKGGVGKTTMTAAIGAELVMRGKKVLLIDTDSQAHLTARFLTEDKVSKEFADYLFEEKDKDAVLRQAIVKTIYKNLYIIPTKKLSDHGRIDAWSVKAGADVASQKVFKKLISTLAQLNLDYVLFDMPPSYTVLNQLTIAACDEIIPVLKIDADSITGFTDFYKLLNKLKDGEEKPFLKTIIFNDQNKSRKNQNELLPSIDKMPLEKVIFPHDEAFETSRRLRQAVQTLKIKKETRECLENIANKLMEE